MASSSKMPDKPPVCKQFLRYSCKFGSRCKYLHERSGQSGPGGASEPYGQGDGNRGGISHERPRPDGRASIVPANPPSLNHSSRSASNSTRSGFNTNRSPRSGGDGWGKFADWTARLTVTKQSRSQMRFVWEEALSILEGLDPNLIQNIAKRLVGTNNIGRQYIEQVVNHDYSGSPDTDYLAGSVPFLLFMTHPEVVNSLSIDRQVGTLYNYLYGTNGTKAVQFFGNLAKQLSNESNPTNRISRAWNSGLLGNPPSFSKALASTVECLRHTMRRNQNSGFSEDFRVVAEAFCILANLVPRHDEFYNSVDASLREIIGIHRQLNLIIERPALVAQDAGDNHVMSSFPAEIDFPGYLSNDGPRHDNDSVAIHEIQLLPTLSEIMSERKDYLPFKDPSQPHFLTGVDRHLDVHFRLLRHDYIAAIKNAVGMVFDLLKLPQQQRNAAFQSVTRKTIQCFIYTDVHVATAKFDRQGLQLGLQFLQPPPIVSRPPKEQENWWNEQKRFERGTLACLVTSIKKAPRATFLVICEREKGYWVEDDPASRKHGCVYVQVVESKKRGEDVDFLLGQLSPLAEPATQILLEFPGIIPATFIPVLQNLQDLSQQGTLPLSRWISPEPEGILTGPATSQIDNLPPAYSRSGEFRWDLKPILKNQSEKYFLSSTTQSDDTRILEALETMTNLDRGQSKALITGLTKEISLIQGPPGTGKSYVGVQLVRVLLHNKPRTNIGPIVCVYVNHRTVPLTYPMLLTNKLSDVPLTTHWTNFWRIYWKLESTR